MRLVCAAAVVVGAGVVAADASGHAVLSHHTLTPPLNGETRLMTKTALCRERGCQATLLFELPDVDATDVVEATLSIDVGGDLETAPAGDDAYYYYDDDASPVGVASSQAANKAQPIARKVGAARSYLRLNGVLVEYCDFLARCSDGLLPCLGGLDVTEDVRRDRHILIALQTNDDAMKPVCQFNGLFDVVGAVRATLSVVFGTTSLATTTTTTRSRIPRLALTTDDAAGENVKVEARFDDDDVEEEEEEEEAEKDRVEMHSPTVKKPVFERDDDDDDPDDDDYFRSDVGFFEYYYYYREQAGGDESFFEYYYEQDHHDDRAPVVSEDDDLYEFSRRTE